MSQKSLKYRKQINNKKKISETKQNTTFKGMDVWIIKNIQNMLKIEINK